MSEKEEKIKFPVDWNYRIIVDISRDGCHEAIVADLKAHGIDAKLEEKSNSSSDKYQSYMRSTMRATAEAHGKDTIISGNDTIYKWRRDPNIAEAMVDPSVFIEGIIDTGKVLTFTPGEAIKYGFCEGVAENIPEVLQKVGIEEYRIVEYSPSFIERIIGFLVHPVVSGLLIMAIIGGIYFEMQSPGIGFPIGLAILAAVLYFAPLYLEGLAAHWEVIVFLVGLILIAVEIFVIPGFGIVGLLGITCIIVSFFAAFGFQNFAIASQTIAY